MEELNVRFPRLASIFAKDTAKDLVSLLVLFALVVLFAGEMFWDNKAPFFRDLYNYFYPLRFSLSEALKNGEIPLWNRHMAMGFPLLADIQTGVFYPPHLIFLILPFFDAIRSIFLIHYLIAASGAYLLWRHWGLPEWQSIIGSLLFTLGGTSVSLINLLNHFQSAVWLPWAVLFWEKFLLQMNWARFIILVFALVMQLLGGSPEILAMSIVLLWLNGMRVGEAGCFTRLLRSTCWLIAAILLVILLSAVQLLPTLELIQSSRRQEGIPFVEASSWSLNPWALLNFLFLDKKVDMGLGDATQMFFGLNVPFLVSYYFGAMFVPAVWLWLRFASTKERLLLGAMIIGTLLLAFGRFTPIYPFLYEHCAPFRSFRYPEKLFFLTQAFLLFVACKGLAGFSFPSKRHGESTIIGGYGLILLFIYFFLRFDPTTLWNFVVQQKAVPLPLNLTIANTAAALVSIERQLGLTLGFFILCLLGKQGYLRAGLFKCLFVLVVFLDLYSAHAPFQYLLKPEPVLDKSKVIPVPEKSASRIFYYPENTNLHPSTFVIRKPVTTPFSEIVTSVATNLLPNFGLFYGFDYLQDINALAKESYTEFLRYANTVEPEKQVRLLAALNVRHVISFKSLNIEGLRLLRHHPEHPSWLYETQNVVPRVYIAQNTRLETTPHQMMQQFSTAGFNAAAEVFVDRIVPIRPTEDFSSKAEIVEYANLTVKLRAVSNGPAVLVLADTHFPGWRVYVDGKEEKLLRANYFFRGVAIPTGEHSVEFKYDPFPFKLGLFVSMITALILFLVTLILLVRARRRISAIRSRRMFAPVPAS